MTTSKIEWTEATWNPVVGCSVISPGCTNCYAMKQAGRIQKMNPTGGSNSNYVNHYDGTTKQVNGNVVWTGKIAIAPDRIFLEPLRRKKPTIWFVNSMGDLFHEALPDEAIDKLFAVMALCPQHTFQVLTKRPERMRRYMSYGGPTLQTLAQVPQVGRDLMVANTDWPLPNVWLGVSAEDQQRADERIPLLLSTPAAVRFVSLEPLLGPIDLTGVDRVSVVQGRNALSGGTKVDWVIVGGESGPHARPMHPDWARSLRDQCAQANAPFFFKQWGEWLGGEANRDRALGPMNSYRRCDNGSFEWPYISRSHSFDHVDPWSGDVTAKRIGKKAAGRLLDGIEHNALPVRP
jgi:protein gp37